MAFVATAKKALGVGMVVEEEQMRVCDVVAAEDCECWELDVRDFVSATKQDMSSNADVMKLLSTVSDDRLEEALRLGVKSNSLRNYFTISKEDARERRLTWASHVSASETKDGIESSIKNDPSSNPPGLKSIDAGAVQGLGFLRHYAEDGRNLSIFECMSENSRIACFEQMVRRQYRKGKSIVEKNGVGTALYFIEKGSAVAVEGGRDLRKFGAGEFFGEMAFVATAKKALGVGMVVEEEQMRVCDVVAAEDCECWELDVRDFVSATKQDMSSNADVMKLLSTVSDDRLEEALRLGVKSNSLRNYFTISKEDARERRLTWASHVSASETKDGIESSIKNGPSSNPPGLKGIDAGAVQGLGFLRHYAEDGRNLSIFECMSENSRIACFEQMVRRQYRKGKSIVEKNGVGTALYFIEKGSAVAVEGGRDLRKFGAGEFFGEMAFVATAKKALGVGMVVEEEQMRVCDVVAAEDCECWELDVRDFVSATKQDMSSNADVMKLLSTVSDDRLEEALRLGVKSNSLRNYFTISKEDARERRLTWASHVSASETKDGIESSIKNGPSSNPPGLKGIDAGAVQGLGFLRHYAEDGRNLSIFECMSENSRIACFEQMVRRQYRKGKSIVEKNGVGTALYFIEKGSAVAVEGGRDLRKFGAGEFFGEMAFAATAKKALGVGMVVEEEQMRVCDVVAAEDCECWELDVRDFVSATKQDMSSNADVMKLLSTVSDDRLEEALRLGVKSNSLRNYFTISKEDARERRLTWASHVSASETKDGIESSIKNGPSSNPPGLKGIDAGAVQGLGFLRHYAEDGRNLSIFECMSENSRIACFEQMVRRQYRKGKSIVEKNGVGTALYFIEKGSAVAVEGGRDLRKFGAGEFFGEMAFVATAKKALGVGMVVEEEQMRVCDVVAAEDCECWELDVRDFVSATKQDMSSNADVMKLLSTVSDDRLEEALRLGVKSNSLRNYFTISKEDARERRLTWASHVSASETKDGIESSIKNDPSSNPPGLKSIDAGAVQGLGFLRHYAEDGRNLSIFECMSENSRIACFEQMVRRQYRKGKSIVEKNGVGTALYFIEKGSAVAVEGGRDLRKFGAGEFFGEMAFVATAKKALGVGMVVEEEQMRVCDVVAAEDCECWELDVRDFVSATKQDMSSNADVMKLLSTVSDDRLEEALRLGVKSNSLRNYFTISKEDARERRLTWASHVSASETKDGIESSIKNGPSSNPPGLKSIDAGAVQGLGFLRHYAEDGRNLSIFECMSENSRIACFEQMVRRQYRKGKSIVEKNGVGTALYFIEKGSAVAVEGGRDLRKFGAGEFFGEMAFVATAKKALGVGMVVEEEQMRVCDVVAAEDCECWELDVRDFVSATKQDMSSNADVMKLLSTVSDDRLEEALRLGVKSNSLRNYFTISKEDARERRLTWASHVSASETKDGIESSIKNGPSSNPPGLKGIDAGAVQGLGFLRHYAEDGRNLSIFECMSENSRIACFEQMVRRQYRKGKSIVEKNGVGTALYFIEKGSAVAVEGGRDLRKFGAGEFFGEMAFAATAKKALGVGMVVEEEQMRVCDVVAAEDCECWELDVRDFVSATKQDMSSNADVMKLLSTVSDDRLEEALRLGVKSNSLRNYFTISKEDARERRLTWASHVSASETKDGIESSIKNGPSSNPPGLKGIDAGAVQGLGFLRHYAEDGRNLSIFECMSENSRIACFEQMVRRQYRKGKSIVEKNGVGTALYFIEKGSAVAVEGGRDLRKFGAGEFFGEMAFVATAKKALGVGMVVEEEQMRVCDVVAAEDCECWELDVRDFVSATKQDMSSNADVMKLLSTVSDDRLEEALRLGVKSNSLRNYFTISKEDARERRLTWASHVSASETKDGIESSIKNGPSSNPPGLKGIDAGAVQGLGFLRHYAEDGRNLSIFECMSENSRIACFEQMVRRQYRKGKSIVEKNGVGTALYFIEKGSAVAVEGGRDLRKFGAGEFFGEMAFVATAKKALGVGMVVEEEQMRVCDVVAAEDCECWELDVRDFVSATKQDMSSNADVMKLLSTVSDDRLEEALRLGVKSNSLRNYFTISKEDARERRLTWASHVSASETKDGIESSIKNDPSSNPPGLKGIDAGAVQGLGFLRHYAEDGRNLSIFECMSENSRIACFEQMVRRQYRKGKSIVEKNGVGTALYFIEKGSAVAVEGGRDLRKFGAGEFFGEMAFAATAKKALGVGMVVEEEQMRVCDVVAAEDCECWELDVRDFVSATKQDMSSNADVMKLLSTVSDDRLEEALRLGVKSMSFRTSVFRDEMSSDFRTQRSSSPPSSPLSGVGDYLKDAVSRKEAVSLQTVVSNAGRQYLMAVDCRAQVLNSDAVKCMQRHIAPALDFFGSLSPVSRASCVGYLKYCSFQAGEVILEEGTIGSTMYFIDSGQASVTCNGYDIETHEDGGFFGEMAFLATIYSLLTSDLPDEKVDTDNLLIRLGLANLSELRMTRSATVKANVSCECMELNARSFLTSLQDDITSFTAALRVLNDASLEARERALRRRHELWQLNSTGHHSGGLSHNSTKASREWKAGM